MSSLPLSDIRVLEFGHTILGPSCSMVLADLGAEVIKIEPPGGERTRRLKGFGAGYFGYFNRNKKSIVLDLKTKEGIDEAKRLIKTADVVVENMAPETMERLGLGEKDARALKPDLIYCSLKGFLSGPYEHRVALDEVVQMMSGLAYMTGPPGMPLRAGTSITDILGGVFGALGVLAALRKRDAGKGGAFVESALFETAAFLMGQHMTYSAVVGEKIPPMPARVSAWAVYDLFDTKDNERIFIGITSDNHWQYFCQEFGRPDLLADANLRTNEQRIDARPKLMPLLQALFKTMTRAEIAARCERAKLPFAPIAVPEDLFEDPHLNANGSLAATELKPGVVAKLPKLPIRIDGEAFDLRSHPPKPG